ncbi:GAF domain-containing protein [Arthrobacter ginkgonis]
MQQLVALSAARSPERRRDLLQRLIQTCLQAARHGAGQRRVRASYYRVWAASGSKKQRLEPDSSLGRNVTASSVFEKNTKRGNHVWKLLEENQSLFVKDIAEIDTNVIRGWDPQRNRDYATFISVPVRGESEIYGMLTVDAPTPGELTEYDEMYVRCIGLLMASGIALAVSR